MTKIIGILNVTPDSFSDGQSFYKTKDAIAHVHHLIENGTDIIDIGAESTRPGATTISYTEEWKRLKDILPEIVKIVHNNKIEISVDTRNIETIKRSIDMGVNYINDVSAFISPNKLAALKENNTTKLIVSHNLGIPSDTNTILNKTLDPIDTIIKNLKDITKHLIGNGINHDRIIIDPGIGFGKDASQSWNIIRNIDKLKILKFPICIGHSRKSMFENITYPLNRDNATLAVSIFLLQKNIDYIRVHNAKLHKEFFTIYNQLTGK